MVSNILSNRCVNNYFLHLDDFKSKSLPFMDSSRQLNCVQINIRGLKSHFDDLRLFLDEVGVPIDIIIVCETWLKSYQTCLYHIKSYSSTFSCRDDRLGGGIAVYIRKGLAFNVIRSDNGDFPIEFVFIELTQYKGIKLLIYYRPPAEDVNLFLSHLDDVLNRYYHSDILLLGDINIPVNKCLSICNDYNNLLLSYGLLVTNTFATRPVSNNILDHVACNFVNISNITNSTIGSLISDHDYILTMMCLKGKRIPIKLCKKFTDFGKLNVAFANYLNSCCFYNGNPNLIIDRIVSRYNELLTQFSTIKTNIVQAKNIFCPWMDNDLWVLLKRKNNLFKKMKANSNNCVLRQKFNDLNHKFNILKRKSKKQYFEKLFSNINPKDMWRHTNALIGNFPQSQDSQGLLINGELVQNHLIIANYFNDHFINSIKSLSNHSSSRPVFNNYVTCPINSRSLFLKPATPIEVSSIICRLKNNGSGADNLSNMSIKLNCVIFSELLSNLFNMIIQSGEYPSRLKCAKVLPLFKKGDPLLPHSYRPVSLLSVIDKIFEKLIASRLNQFLEDSKYLTTRQFGFRKGMGTESALIELKDFIYSAFDSRMIVGALFLDLQKAFDTINHQILLNKLFAAGVRGLPLKLFESFLNNRSHFVSFNGSCSRVLKISSGVPQGSVLGPILFLIFINDICNLSLRGTLFKFADDIALVYPVCDASLLSELMLHDLDLLANYFIYNDLSLNLNKTKMMIFHSPYKIVTQVPILVIDNTTIEYVDSFKYLGVTLDSKMSWVNHIDILCSKISASNFMLRKLSGFVPINILRNIYFAFVHSRITYGIAAYGSASRSHLMKVQVSQNKCLKAIYSLPILFSTKQLFCEVTQNILPVLALYDLSLCLYMYKIKFLPSTISNLYFNWTSHNYLTRGSHNLHCKQIFSEYGRKSFTYAAPFKFNNLPNHLKLISSFSMFRRTAISYFIDLIVDYI